MAKPGGASPPSSDVLNFLNRTIDWYHQLAVQRQIASQPADLVVVNDNEQIADEVVRLSFEFARAQVTTPATAPDAGSGAAPNGNSQQYKSLTQLLGTLDNQVKQTQADLGNLKQKLAASPPKQRPPIESSIAETQSELDLMNARRDAVHSMLEFVNGASTNGLGAAGARAQIEALARSVPPQLSQPSSSSPPAQSTTNAQTGSVASAGSDRSGASGIWGLASALFSVSGKIKTIDQVVRSTDSLNQTSKQLRAPLINQMKSLSQQGDTLANANSADASTLAQQKKDLDSLTAQFKQISASVLPLSKQGVLLGVYRTNLTNWQAALNGEYRSDLRNLAIRLGVLALVIGGVIGLAELWRRAIVKYIHETRRRYQFLLLRKIVLWIVIALVIAFSFASQLGSVVTFAGLLTAGVAVALQNVILSVAGYFFLIGKFGIRVGDRVQIAGVTGEVVDIGLVRLHLLELGTTGAEIPTGRVVAFSNAVVFQTNTGLFRQIPGTNFVWHEISLTLSADSEYRVVESRLLGTVEAVFADYREEMERQYRQMERTLSAVSVNELRPRSRLRLTPSGIEAVIRFPVDYQNAAEIDDRVTRELLKAIDLEPKLKLVGSGSPTIRLSTAIEAPAAKTGS